jgi:hypothetical protein
MSITLRTLALVKLVKLTVAPQFEISAKKSSEKLIAVSPL